METQILGVKEVLEEIHSHLNPILSDNTIPRRIYVEVLDRLITGLQARQEYPENEPGRGV